MIEITSNIQVSPQELAFSFDRSPGPGGQNVNKSNTRVTLSFDIGRSVSLSTQQKNMLCQVLGTRVSQEKILRIVSSKERTQLANRRAAVNRFVELLTDALSPPKLRRPTRRPASADRRRLDAKKRQGEIKRARRHNGDLEN